MVVDMTYPFTGRWLVQNGPANRVRHGTRLFASSYAIDFVPVDDSDRSAPLTLRSLLVPEPPERFTGFGRVITAPVAGSVLAVHDGEPGQSVASGEALARCGNSGNSTEPHLHLQAMSAPDPAHATALQISFAGVLPRNGEVV